MTISFVVVGLGNPGQRYQDTRHNIGFSVVDALAERWKAGPFREKFRGEYLRTEALGKDIILLKPLTFMNVSGASVGPTLSFFKGNLQQLLVIHDELDLPFGVCRVKVGGGSAGNRGVNSIIEHCKSGEFARLRVGIGRPAAGENEKYVLGRFDSSQAALLPALVERAVSIVETIVREGTPTAMNRWNGVAAVST